MVNKILVIGIIFLFLITTITPLNQGIVNKNPNHPVFVLAEDPIIVNITITPENPTPLSTITFTAEIKGENISEVYMKVKEMDENICMPTINVSMDKIDEEIYECNITLEYANATYIGYTPIVNCKGMWYEFEWRNQTLYREGTIFYVGGSGSGNYTRIQDAIDNASDGDTVFVYDDSSPYHENVVINKSINLIGEDKDTTIISGPWSTVFIQNSNDVNIKNFTITGNNNFIKINNCQNCIIESNCLSGNEKTWGLEGIVIELSTNITVIHNHISKCIWGIGITYSENNITVINNHISRNVWGFCISSSENVNIIQNNFIRNIRPDYLILRDLKNLVSIFFDGNYWSRPRLLPRPIFGTLNEYPILLIKFDRHPAKEPYDI